MRNYYSYLPSLALLGFILYLYLFYDIQGEYARDFHDFDSKRIAIILSVILLLHPLVLFFQEGYKVILRADVLVVISFIYWAMLDLIQERYTLSNMPIEHIRLAFVLVALFCIAVQISSRYRFKMPDIVYESAKTEVKSNYILLLIVICTAIAIFYFWRASYYDFNYMIDALTRPRFRAPWARGSSGGLESFFFHLKYFGYITPALTAIIIVKEGKPNLKVITALALTIFFTLFEFQNGARRILGFLFGSGALTYLMANRNRLTIKHMAVMVALGAMLLILLDMQLTFRNIGYQNMIDRYEFGEFEEIRVDDNFYRITQIIQFVPATHPFSGLKYLVWAFGRPIPRYFWAGKPLDPGFDLAKMAGEFNVSLSMTVVGEAYASFGMIMVILMGIFYGLLCGTFNQLLISKMRTIGYALYATGILSLVSGIRSLSDLIVFSYAFLAIIVVYKFLIKPRKDRIAS